MKTFFSAILAVLACAAHLGQGALFNITSHPSDQVALLGSSVSLSCSATGGQVEQWLHNGQPVADDDAHDITTTGGTSSLTLTAFSAEQSGEYRCQFSTDNGTALSLPGIVRYPVKASTESESITINAFISQDLTITCVARGNSGAPELMIFTWTRNGQTVRIMPLGTVDGRATDQLNLTNITATDAGIYECHPKNPVGEYNFTTFVVQVSSIDPPMISSVDFTSRPLNDSYVAVCWDPTDYPGVVIEHYVVEILLVTVQGAEVIKSVSVPASQNCINISVPVPDSRNRFAARINAIGRGGMRLTDATEYTFVTVQGTVDNTWWIIFLTTVFGVIALCTIFGVFFICCLFLCPAILDTGRRWKTSYRERRDLEESDGKGHAQRAPTPDSVSSI